jgi:hypothetical protein
MNKIVKLVEHNYTYGLYDVSNANISPSEYEDAFEDMLNQPYDSREEYIEKKYSITRIMIHVINV